MAFCGKCGSGVSDGASFCGSCGALLGATAATATSAALAATAPQPLAPSSTSTAKPRNAVVMVIVVILIVLVIIAVAVVGTGAYLAYRIHKRVEESGVLSRLEDQSGQASGSSTSRRDPCSLATNDQVSEALGKTVEKTVNQGNECDYVISNTNNHSVKATVESGNARMKFMSAAGRVGARPINLTNGEPTGSDLGSGEHAAYAHGSLYFFQHDTFVTIYIGDVYGGLDGPQKAASIARKMLPRI